MKMPTPALSRLQGLLGHVSRVIKKKKKMRRRGRGAHKA
jgi:hypothetical protein